jgi:selenocysteine lyase/cysteine desulfurase
VLAWLRLKPRGLEIRVVERDQNWRITGEALEAACDERTRGIMISQVGYVSGFRHDLGEVSELARRVGAPLFVDASHALGVVPVELDGAAIVISASYKWMLGPYGVGIVIWNRELLPDFEPGSVGWRSTSDIFSADRFERIRLDDDARRFQQGAPSLSGIAGLRAAVEELLALGADVVERHALALSASAISTLRKLGLEVITPDDPRDRAGNVAFLHPDGERIAAALAREGVFVWGGDGRVRASFHVMNGADSVHALSAGLERVFAHVD